MITYKDGHFDCGRVWLTGIMDIASNALVGYVLSTNPNAELIAHAFATASAFKSDSPFHDIYQYWEAICLKFKRHEESDLSELATVIIDRDILRQSSRFQMKK